MPLQIVSLSRTQHVLTHLEIADLARGTRDLGPCCRFLALSIVFLVLCWLVALQLLLSVLEAVVDDESWFVNIQMRGCLWRVASVILNQVLLMVQDLLTLAL